MMHGDPAEVETGKNAVNELLASEAVSEHCFKAECVGRYVNSGHCISSEYCSNVVQNPRSEYRLYLAVIAKYLPMV